MDKENTRNTVEVFSKYALGYQTKYMSVDKYRKSLDLFCSLLPKKNAHLLELACGPGNITKYLRSQKSDLKILATDLSPAMLNLARENNPGVDFQIMDCRSIPDLERKFDAIMCSFGLPYVSKEDALKMIADASISLQPGGLIYLSTMEDSYHKSGYQNSGSDLNERLFMYFHEADYLVEGMEKSAFKLVDLSRYIYTDNHGEEVTDLVLIGEKI